MSLLNQNWIAPADTDALVDRIPDADLFAIVSKYQTDPRERQHAVDVIRDGLKAAMLRVVARQMIEVATSQQ